MMRVANWPRELAVIIICVIISIFALAPGTVAGQAQQVVEWNDSLAQIDAGIQAAGTGPPQSVSGQNAANIVPGVTNAVLDEKRQILNDAGFGNFAGINNYGNFYSFTSMPGFTNTQLSIVETGQPLKLIRRGNHQGGDEITRGYLGAWWSDKYYSVQDTRDKLATLAAWGSDLQDIYVISVPAGTLLIGGLASPMEQGDEYRPGGGYQYWKRSTQTENTLNWLVYALYAPNYLSSYSSAITGGQKLSRNMIGDLGLHMEELRTSPGKSAAGNLWLRAFGNDTTYDLSGSVCHGQSNGLQMGWDKLVRGDSAAEKAKMYFGLVAGHGLLSQNNRSSGVKNDIKGNYAGLYSVFRRPMGNGRAAYFNAAALWGNLDFLNSVPGYYGYGLRQQYSGRTAAASLEHGVTFFRKSGLIVEPQAQLMYSHISQGAFTDHVGADVALSEGDSLQGRLGLELRRQVSRKNGQQTLTRLGVDYIREFQGKNTIAVSGERNENHIGRNVYRLNLGINTAFSRNLCFQGQISRLFGNERGYQGTVSLRVNW